jgi:hypothetical protein
LSESVTENLNVALFLKQVKRIEIRAPRGSTIVITEEVEISEVKRSDKNTATSFLFLFCGKKEK